MLCGLVAGARRRGFVTERRRLAGPCGRGGGGREIGGHEKEHMRALRALLAALLAAGYTGCDVNVENETDRIFSDYRGTASPGAAVMVLRNGEPVLVRCYGMADLARGLAVTPETNFRLASVSKQFTAMSILILVERGELTLDRTLTAIFPDFPAWGGDVTLTHLLQHTSGLADYEPFVPDDSPVQVRDRGVLEIMKQQDGTRFEPGSRHRYSNSGYAVLAMVVEQVSGQPYARFLEENIFGPLGMSHTVAFEDGVSRVENRAYGYHVTAEGVEESDQSPWSAVLGDGGIYTSLTDLARWDAALHAGELVSAELYARAFTPHLENYGFGWRMDTYRGHRRMHHEGTTIGFRNFIQRFPDERLTVIVLSNRREPGVEAMAERVADLFLPGESRESAR